MAHMNYEKYNMYLDLDITIHVNHYESLDAQVLVSHE